MIVGNGDVASVLPERDDLLFFASGVSNSQETNPAEYLREMDLLLKQPHEAHVVYFSSLAVLTGGVSRYVEHKRQMESVVSSEFPRHTLVRIGNITWGTNPHTFINYMRGQRERGEELEVRDEFRHVVDQDEFLYWVNLIPPWNAEMNIPGRRMKVQEAIDEYC